MLNSFSRIDRAVVTSDFDTSTASAISEFPKSGLRRAVEMIVCCVSVILSRAPLRVASRYSMKASGTSCLVASSVDS